MAKIVVVGNFAPWLINFRGPMLREMAAAGHEVTACAPAASRDIIEALSRMGVRYRHIPVHRGGVSPLSDLVTLYRIHRLCGRLKPDIYFGYTVKPVVYGAAAAMLAGVPTRISMVEGLGYAFGEKGGYLKRLVLLLYWIAARASKRIFFLNPDDMALFSRLGIVPKGEKAVRLNGTGVDPDLFRPVPLPAGERIVFLLIARFLVDKGIREYAAAAEKIRVKYPEAEFRLVGWIDDYPASLSPSEVKAWEEKGVLRCLGRLEDVRPALAGCSVFVLPSYREGVPRTVLEAMAMGRPVITTDAPGCRETVEEGRNGFLVPPGDVDALARAMERFLNAPDLMEPMGKEGRKMVEERFDVKKVNRVILGTLGMDGP